MKKFIYSFAVIAALGMVACGGSKTEATEEAPEAEVVTEVVEEATCCNDSTACCNDSTACCEAAEAAEAAAAVVE